MQVPTHTIVFLITDILDQTFSYILRKLTAEQLKWFLRIILKDMRLGVSDNHILSCFHPDAPEIYKMTNSLSKVRFNIVFKELSYFIVTIGQTNSRLSGAHGYER